jgi:hypothetical protein
MISGAKTVQRCAHWIDVPTPKHNVEGFDTAKPLCIEFVFVFRVFVKTKKLILLPTKNQISLTYHHQILQFFFIRFRE